MSVENVKIFFQRVQTDAELRAKLKGVKATNKEEATLAIIALASAAGLPFDAEQYDQATRAHQGPAGRPAPGQRSSQS
jgi:predicted ribosomally synthesized peptide with nif11-like leader